MRVYQTKSQHLSIYDPSNFYLTHLVFKMKRKTMLIFEFDFDFSRAAVPFEPCRMRTKPLLWKKLESSMEALKKRKGSVWAARETNHLRKMRLKPELRPGILTSLVVSIPQNDMAVSGKLYENNLFIFRFFIGMRHIFFPDYAHYFRFLYNKWCTFN